MLLCLLSIPFTKVTKVYSLLCRGLVRSFASEAPVRFEKSKSRLSFFDKKKTFEMFFIRFTAMNTVTLLGRVGAEPQKRGSNEHPVVTFSLATHDNYKCVRPLSDIY